MKYKYRSRMNIEFAPRRLERTIRRVQPDNANSELEFKVDGQWTRESVLRKKQESTNV